MTPQSAKAKGRKLQQWVRDKILQLFPELTEDDVRSTSMGASGQDIQLSTAARNRVPCAIECKNRENLKTLYAWYDQPGQTKWEKVLVVKSNHREPLAVIDAAWFFELMRIRHLWQVQMQTGVVT